VAFPDDYQSKEVAGKTVHYEIELLEIKKKVLPDLDDDFAKDTGRADTLEDLKEDIRKTLRESNHERARSEEERQIVDAIVGVSDFEIPPSMMELQTQNNIRRTLQYSMYSGVPREDLIERKEEIHKKASEDSERQIRLFLLLQKIAEAEKIRVEEKDVNAFIEDIAKRRQADPKELRRKMEEDDEIDSVKNRLLHEKILKFLHENAKKK
jgi:trigger factor